MRCWAPVWKQLRLWGLRRELRGLCSSTRMGKVAVSWLNCPQTCSLLITYTTLLHLICSLMVLSSPPIHGVCSNRSEREVRGAGLVLQTVWGYKELRRTLEKDGWKKSDFMVNLNPPSNNTRSNGGYEDSTMPLIDKGMALFTIIWHDMRQSLFFNNNRWHNTIHYLAASLLVNNSAFVCLPLLHRRQRRQRNDSNEWFGTR